MLLPECFIMKVDVEGFEEEAPAFCDVILGPDSTI